MKALILAAGKGKRLLPITEEIPKAMVEIGGRPILEKIINQLKDQEVTDLIIVVGYKKEVVQNYFGDGTDLGVRISYIEQKELLGTGHAVLLAKDVLSAESDFLLIFADTIFDDISLQQIMSAQGEGIVGVVHVDDPRRFGVVKIGSDKIVEYIIEKPEIPPSSLAVAGIYRLPTSIFNALQTIPLSPRGEYELPHAVNALIKNGVVFRTVILHQFVDIGTIEQLKQARLLV
ncbi:MAG: nucleotidyltransferase family protein [Nanoarchaeota archaeon]